LGTVKADAAGIAYAVERDWLIISGGLHSVNLTEAGPWMRQATAFPHPGHLKRSLPL
jgi:hypothetical protein